MQIKQEKERKEMRRENMVTRTMKTTEATFLCINVESAEPFNQTISLPGTYKSDEAIEKRGCEIINKDGVRMAALVSKEEKEALYGMPETVFIAHAKVLPPRQPKENQ